MFYNARVWRVLMRYTPRYGILIIKFKEMKELKNKTI